MMSLKQQVLEHPRNQNIQFFEEPHIYVHTPTGENWKGVTSLISNYAEDFPREQMAKYVAQRDGTTPERVLAQWDRKGQKAIQYGNKVHKMIEDHVNEGITPEDNEDFEAYQTAIEELGLEPVCCEWVIYDERIKRASAIDGVYQLDGALVIIDY